MGSLGGAWGVFKELGRVGSVGSWVLDSGQIDFFAVQDFHSNFMWFNRLCGNENVADFVGGGSIFLSSGDPDSDISREHVVIFSVVMDFDSDNFSFVSFSIDVEFSIN